MSPPPSKKPHFQLPDPPPMNHQTPIRSLTNPIFAKAPIIIILLLVIPLFPSQAPDFITQTILTDFWEIIHLLFIGIAVSYGVFSSKNARIAPEKDVHSRIDENGAYLSGISRLSSVFEDGFENLCGSHELDVMRGYTNSTKIESFLDESEINCEGNVGNSNRVSRYRYSKGESLVVVSNGECFVDGGTDFKPLNLPVRSLRSRIVDNNEHVLKNRGDDDYVKVVKIRGVVPMNLEKKFEEVAETPSIPWRSRSGRMESREKTSDLNTHLHYRPHSIGEFEFERNLKSSRSFGGSTFSSSMELGNIESKKDPNREQFLVSTPKNGTVNAIGGNFEFDRENFGNNGEEGKIGKGKQAIESLELGKVLSRAKSVRTIKPRGGYIVDEKRTFKRGRVEEPENPPIINRQNQEFDSIFPMPKPKPTLLEFHSVEKKDIDDDRSISESEEDMESELDESSCEESETRNNNNVENDVELEGSEVDRKAGEFIAKFREQIRLQKMSSSRRSSN